MTHMETSSLPAKGCTIKTYMLRPLGEDSLSCHTCCDPGPFLESSEGMYYFSRVLRQAHGT